MLFVDIRSLLEPVRKCCTVVSFVGCRSLLQPVRKGWTVVLLLGTWCLLEPVRKSWTELWFVGECCRVIEEKPVLGGKCPGQLWECCVRRIVLWLRRGGRTAV